MPTFNVVLISPEIPQNTGNIIRLCANVGAYLHLVKPLGFKLDDPRLKRASLDYSDIANVVVHESSDQLFSSLLINRVFAATTNSIVPYTQPNYELGDTIILGRESLGLSDDIVENVLPENRVHIPMQPANRSLNLSNAAAIIVYEMWRQLHFDGALSPIDNNKSYFS
ncbi:MAG: tRNA (cytidine(34)-2'-O)-methyltransferase [Chloroflexota bacterium]|nr:tRNA (cytidine(34)-2'-O)-methyltransferase [Chloroflexota bacterium]